MPAIPPVVAHLGLEGEVPDLGHEVVLHGDPMLVVRTGGQRARRLRRVDRARPRRARRGHPARAGPPQDRRPRAGRHPGRPLARATWSSAGTARRWACSGRAAAPSAARLGPTTPIAGVYAAGAHATPGGGLPFVGPVRGTRRAGHRAGLSDSPRRSGRGLAGSTTRSSWTIGVRPAGRSPSREAVTLVSPGSKPASIFVAYAAPEAVSAISDGTCATPSLTICELTHLGARQRRRALGGAATASTYAASRAAARARVAGRRPRARPLRSAAGRRRASARAATSAPARPRSSQRMVRECRASKPAGQPLVVQRRPDGELLGGDPALVGVGAGHLAAGPRRRRRRRRALPSRRRRRARPRPGRRRCRGRRGPTRARRR